MKICKQCHKVFFDHANFCMNCGAQLEARYPRSASARVRDWLRQHGQSIFKSILYLVMVGVGAGMLTFLADNFARFFN